MFRWQTLTGAAIGVIAGLALVGLTDTAALGPAPCGPILSESDGHLRELVIQYEPSAKEIVAATYRGFLGALDADVTVRVVCPDRAAFEDFQATVGRVRCKVSAIIAGHPMTTWSRDRWVALTPASRNGRVALWSPRGEAADEVWPARAGDERVGGDIAAALRKTVSARRSSLYFDGGDFLADADNVFAIPRVLARNLQQTVTNREELLQILSGTFKRHVILLNESPDHHAGMFMASVGGKTMLVGDPGLGKPLFQCAGPATNAFMDAPGGPDFSPETQRLFDAVADQCAAAGYRVIRIPTVPGSDGRTYLTFVNVLLDQKDGRRIVYLPCYRGYDILNAAGRAVWERLGYEVRPVDCTDTYRHFGCLHCLVNVLSRS